MSSDSTIEEGVYLILEDVLTRVAVSLETSDEALIQVNNGLQRSSVTSDNGNSDTYMRASHRTSIADEEGPDVLHEDWNATRMECDNLHYINIDKVWSQKDLWMDRGLFDDLTVRNFRKRHSQAEQPTSARIRAGSKRKASEDIESNSKRMKTSGIVKRAVRLQSVFDKAISSRMKLTRENLTILEANILMANAGMLSPSKAADILRMNENNRKLLKEINVLEKEKVRRMKEAQECFEDQRTIVEFYDGVSSKSGTTNEELEEKYDQISRTMSLYAFLFSGNK